MAPTIGGRQRPTSACGRRPSICWPTWTAQPSTLQSGLVAATASTDTLPPVTAITAPAAGASVPSGAIVTVNGTASDTGGVVTAVEVSVDGGATWKRATGRATWTLSFTAGAAGSLTIRSRGIDDSGNIENPGASRSILMTGGLSGLVAAYSFDEGSGTTTADLSGRGNAGTLNGATWTAGKNGNGLSFNGTSAMVTIADSASLHLTTAMTLEAWVRPTIVGSWRTVLMKETVRRSGVRAVCARYVPARGLDQHVRRRRGVGRIGAYAKRLDASGFDLRRRDPASVRERRPDCEPPGHRYV